MDFDIAVFAVNEAETIKSCLRSIDRACAGYSAHISVLLNGTTDQSIAILKALNLSHAAMTVYFFPVADKANAINSFLYDLRREATVHFAIDAYTQIGESSFRAIAQAFNDQPRASMASGIPISGRSAETYAKSILRGGAVAGQLYAIRPDFLDRLVAAGFRLPLQIYRGDPLLGSIAAHDLDAIGKSWDNSRIIGVPNATFALTPLSIFKWRDIQRQYKREIRQARGRMENEAIKSIIYSKGYKALPANANDMIMDWLKLTKPLSLSMRERFFTQLALRQLTTLPKVEETTPNIVFSTCPSQVANQRADLRSIKISEAA